MAGARTRGRRPRAVFNGQELYETSLNHVKLDGLTPAEQDAIAVLRGDLAKVRQVKSET